MFKTVQVTQNQYLPETVAIPQKHMQSDTECLGEKLLKTVLIIAIHIYSPDWNMPIDQDFE